MAGVYIELYVVKYSSVDAVAHDNVDKVAAHALYLLSCLLGL